MRSLFLFLIVEAAWSLGCNGDGKSCDPGQVEENNVCAATPADAGDAAVPDATPGDVATSTDTNGGDVDSFGKSCTTAGVSPECAEPAPYCAIQPGGTTGYCTATDCKDDPSRCPATWTCFDVGVVNFCFKP